MEQQLKILYKDESGNLKLPKIGSCYIYVFNDGEQNGTTPYFWIISKDKKVISYFSLIKYDLIDKYLVYTNPYTNRNIYLSIKDQEKIYNYITTEKANIASTQIMWCEMINRYYRYKNRSLYFGKSEMNMMMNNTLFCSDIFPQYPYYSIDENFSEILDFGDRLGKCIVKLTNQFADNPILSIQSNRIPFYGFISMLTGKYFGGDTLTENEYKVLDDYMRIRPNFHSQSHGPDFFDKSSNWYFILNDYLTFDGYIDNALIKKCINYTDVDNQIPKFNSEEYSINMNLNDYINKLVKGEVIL